MTEAKQKEVIAEENSTQDVPVNEGEQTLEVKADATSEGGEQPNQDKENSESSTYNLVLGAVCFSVAAIALAAWSLWGNKPEQYRVVDLAEVSKFYQEQAREQGLKEGVTNEQRGMILGRLQSQMNTLKSVTDAYAKECDCTLFVRSAIVADNGKSIDVSNEIVNRINKAVEAAAITPVKIPESPSPFVAPATSPTPVPQPNQGQ